MLLFASNCRRRCWSHQFLLVSKRGKCSERIYAITDILQKFFKINLKLNKLQSSNTHPVILLRPHFQIWQQAYPERGLARRSTESANQPNNYFLTILRNLDPLRICPLTSGNIQVFFLPPASKTCCPIKPLNSTSSKQSSEPNGFLCWHEPCMEVVNCTFRLQTSTTFLINFARRLHFQRQ